MSETQILYIVVFTTLSGYSKGHRVYNVLFEIVFADGITWFARCPLTYNCSSQDASDILMEKGNHDVG